MLRCLSRGVEKCRYLQPELEKCRYLQPTVTTVIQRRNTVIVKRVHKPPLVTGEHVTQKKIDESVIGTDDDQYCIYQVEEEDQPEHEVKVILKRSVDDFGKKGQVVNVPYRKAHKYLLLPGFAVYHTEENVARYADIIIPEDVQHNSSETARVMINYWSKRVLDITLNMDVPWTIEKWHIKAALRKHRLWVTEDRIEIPGGEISGPDLSLESKEFVALVDVSHLEKLKIRCRIHHHTDDFERQIKTPFWYHKMAEPVWESERLELINMAKAPPNEKQQKIPELKTDLENYFAWKKERELRLENE